MAGALGLWLRDAGNTRLARGQRGASRATRALSPGARQRVGCGAHGAGAGPLVNGAGRCGTGASGSAAEATPASAPDDDGVAAAGRFRRAVARLERGVGRDFARCAVGATGARDRRDEDARCSLAATSRTLYAADP